MMRSTLDQRSTRASVTLAAAALLASAVAAGAQQTQLASTDGRWTPWVGCWQASSRDAVTQELAPNKSLPVVCVVPAPGNATVDLVTIDSGTAGKPERVDANGSRRAVDREGCTGWETAQFSADAKRIYVRSEHQCTGNRTRTSTGIMSISPNGEWLDVQGVKVDTHSGVRVVHYGRVPAPASLSADMKAALEGRQLATTTAVIAASDSVRIADVIDATRNVDPLVVQTWLAQRGQGFHMDAKRLTQLADAKVPSNVIDVMVALSYPQAFAINLAQADGRVTPTGRPAQVADADVDRNGPIVYMNWDPFYSNGYYGYNGYGYRNGYGYGYGYGGNWYGGPVVIVRPSDTVNQPRETRGRMVRGSGYTRPSSDGSSSGSPRGSTSGSGSSSSGGSSSGGSTSSGGGETRTAKPRP
jgi:uncharacterized membrane protein YgcG